MAEETGDYPSSVFGQTKLDILDGFYKNSSNQ